MFMNIKNWLKSPVFPDDEEKTRRAYVHTVLQYSLISTILLGGCAGVLFFFEEKLITSAIIIFALSFTILNFYLIRRGAINQVSIITLVVLWILTVFMIYISNGMRSLDVMFFISGTVLAGILLGLQGALFYAGISTVTSLAFALMARAGYEFPIKFTFPPLGGWIVLLINFGFTIFPLHMMLRSLADALAKARQEIAERKQIEIERESLIEKLETQNAELERFAYTVSHDLKSPLITIGGFLGYLEEDALKGNTEKLKRDIQRISKAVDKMQALLYGLLELSRIGRMMNAPETIPFSDLVHDAMENVYGQLEAGRVTVQTQPDLPAVTGDRQRLVEVLQNLIDNAIKFMGDQPNPLIEIGQSGENAEHGKSIFYVKDNGIGIAPEHHERIFGLFNQLDPKIEGTGVGLALVKRIIEFHGGRVWVESEPGKGTTFFFTLSRQAFEAVK